MIRLLNSAVMPAPGTYTLEAVEFWAFIRELQLAREGGELMSYLGYPQNAELLAGACGFPIPLSRESTEVEEGDTLLIMRLRYRVQDPTRKGQPVAPEDFEYFRCEYRKP